MATSSVISISPEVMSVLEGATITGNVLKLSSFQLDRKLYLSTNKVLEVLGGKWNRSAKGHVFETDPRDRIESALLTGQVIDLKKVFQFYETPAEIANYVAILADLKPGLSVCEPSAGKGRIADALILAQPDIRLTLIELDTDRANILWNCGYPNSLVITDDFLDSRRTHDRFVMNPPFTRQQDIAHVMHAYSLLNLGGILVAIVSESVFVRSTKEARAFQAIVNLHGVHVESLPPDTFKDSGACVRTRIVKIRKGGR